MASQSNEIGDIMKKVKVLLLDIEGTTTSISFVKDKLFPYAEENVKKFLSEYWETDEVKEAVCALRKLALEDEEQSVEGLVKIPAEDATKDVQIEGLVNNVKWQMSSDRKVGALKQLQGLIWKQGYDNGDIKGHVFDDVSPALEQWHGVDDQKVFIYSSGSVQAQKLLFGQSQAGDLLKYIDGHFDTAVGAKQESSSYTKIVEQIGVKPEEILFLTDIPKEGEAARSAGLQVALLSREGNAPLPDDVTASYPVLQTFAQLSATLKRKPDVDAQDDVTQPAKVPKTETEVAKSTSVDKTSAKTESVENKMEVDEEIKTESTKTQKEKPVVVETIIEDVTEITEPIDAPVVTTGPIITELKEESNKADVKEVETMETDVTTVTAENNVTAETPVAEETPPAIITEIKDVTDDKETLEEVADIIEDLEPVIEEPQTMETEMAELQNVGEELEKECDEILSKVQDVTNLDNMTVKPYIENSSSKEMIEEENLDTMDIVDSILDNERDSEIKISEDIKKAEELKQEKKPENETNEASDIIEKPAEKSSTEEDKVTETKTEAQESGEKTTETKVATKETKAETPETKVEPVDESKVEESSSEADSVAKTTTDETEKPEVKPDEPKTAAEKDLPEETKNEAAAEEKKSESIPETPQVNGNETNGNIEAVNGDTSKEEELSSRLTAENGKEVVNGANGDNASSNGTDVEAVKKTEEVSDIKVKSVAAETRTDPIEQATEA